jgi:hypothetical protein
MTFAKSLAAIGSLSMMIAAPACDGAPVDLGNSAGKGGAAAPSGGSATAGGAASGGTSASSGSGIGGDSSAGRSAGGGGSSSLAGAPSAGMSDGGSSAAGVGGSSGTADCAALPCGAPCGAPGGTNQCSISHRCTKLVAPCPAVGSSGATSDPCAGKACGEDCFVSGQIPGGVCTPVGNCSSAGTPPPCI